MEKKIKNREYVKGYFIYPAIGTFLEKYNKHLQSEDINGLISEIEQAHIAQRTMRQWIEALEETIKEFEEFEEEEKQWGPQNDIEPKP